MTLVVAIAAAYLVWRFMLRRDPATERASRMARERRRAFVGAVGREPTSIGELNAWVDANRPDLWGGD